MKSAVLCLPTSLYWLLLAIMCHAFLPEIMDFFIVKINWLLHRCHAMLPEIMDFYISIYLATRCPALLPELMDFYISKPYLATRCHAILPETSVLVNLTWLCNTS